MPKSDDRDFHKKAKKIVDEIQRDSKGHHCGDCLFYRGAYCSRDWVDWDQDILINTPDAVACPHWEKKK